MSCLLIYTPRARHDIEVARRWLTQPGSGLKGRRKLQAIVLAIEGLRETPCLHPVWDHPGIRELPCAGGYRVFYRVVPDVGESEAVGEVHVLRIFGPGQDRSQVAP